jgi:hypothetical protein
VPPCKRNRSSRILSKRRLLLKWLPTHPAKAVDPRIFTATMSATHRLLPPSIITIPPRRCSGQWFPTSPRLPTVPRSRWNLAATTNEPECFAGWDRQPGSGRTAATSVLALPLCYHYLHVPGALQEADRCRVSPASADSQKAESCHPVRRYAVPSAEATPGDVSLAKGLLGVLPPIPGSLGKRRRLPGRIIDNIQYVLMRGQEKTK